MTPDDIAYLLFEEGEPCSLCLLNNYATFEEFLSFVKSKRKNKRNCHAIVHLNDIPCLIEDQTTFDMIKTELLSRKPSERIIKCPTTDIAFILNKKDTPSMVVVHVFASVRDTFDQFKQACIDAIEENISHLFYLHDNRQAMINNDLNFQFMWKYYEKLSLDKRRITYETPQSVESILKTLYSKIKPMHKSENRGIYKCLTKDGEHVVVKIKMGVQYEDIIREFVKTYNLDHPYIIKVNTQQHITGKYFSRMDNDFNFFSGYEMPYCTNGSLHNQIQSDANRDQFNEHSLWIIFMKLVSAVHYIQTKQIIHRDIKLDNILITNIEVCDNIENFCIALADFEYALSWATQKSHIESSSTYCGTPNPAPEILEGKPVSFLSDVYSTGLTILQLASKKVSGNVAELLSKIHGNYSDELVNLIQDMVRDYNNRPTIGQVLIKCNAAIVRLGLMKYIDPAIIEQVKKAKQTSQHDSQFITNEKERERIRQSVAKGGLLLEFVEEKYKKDRYIVLAAVTANGRSYRYIDMSLRTDKEIALRALASGATYILSLMDKSLRADRDVVLAAVSNDGSALQYADASLQIDREIVKIAVSRVGVALQYADASLRIDREIVKIAVSKSGSALEYADASLQIDREIVKIAVSTYGPSLEYADASLRIDREIVKIAVSESGSALKYADASFRIDREIVKIAVSKSGSALEYADISLRKDKEIVCIALNQSYAAEPYVHSMVRQDEDVNELIEVGRRKERARNQKVVYSSGSSIDSLKWRDREESFFVRDYKEADNENFSDVV